MISDVVLQLQTGALNEWLRLIYSRLAQLDFSNLIRVSSVVLLSLILVWVLLFINNKLNDRFNRKRTRIHHLTISNNGNTRSIFLLRTLDLPNTIALRFRIGGTPMIHVTQTSDASEAPAAPKEAAPAEAPVPAEPVPSRKKSEPSLIPDLSDPLETAGGAARNVQKTTGTAATALGYMASLSPVKSAALSESQAALKGVQQATGDAVNTVATKIRAFDALKNIFAKVFPGLKPKEMKDLAPSAVMNQSSLEGLDQNIGGSVYLPDSIRSKNLIYDEEVWKNSIGKTDKEGGALNYVQTKVLAPGESMRIDLEIMNLTKTAAPSSYYYKIEVLQVPMTRLPLSAPRRIINGIVTFKKISHFDTFAPPIIMLGLLTISIQLIALFSRWIFR